MDKEWLELIEYAIREGFTKEDIRKFIRGVKDESTDRETKTEE